MSVKQVKIYYYVRPLLGSESPPGEPAPLGSELDHLTNDVLLARARIFLEELVARAHAGDVEAVDKLWELANLVACSLERLAEEHADIMKIIAVFGQIGRRGATSAGPVRAD